MGASVSAETVPCVSIQLVMRDTVGGLGSGLVVLRASAFLWGTIVFTVVVASLSLLPFFTAVSPLLLPFPF